VLWDHRERTLVAAVDGFGINRLVVSDTGGVLLVASRIDALFCAGECAADVNPKGDR
jgi:asparagine synthetase B (glutamine-hydrolysing)